MFQTLELIDFKNSLRPSNLDILIRECGLFIAHTYFSAPLNHHRGRLFDDSNEIPLEIEKNFEYLSQKIKHQKIWNPTLSELVDYFSQLSKVSFSCNEMGKVLIKDQFQLPFKEVS